MQEYEIKIKSGKQLISLKDKKKLIFYGKKLICYGYMRRTAKFVTDDIMKLIVWYFISADLDLINSTINVKASRHYIAYSFRQTLSLMGSFEHFSPPPLKRINFLTIVFNYHSLEM